jgi:hypothetical protein
MIVQTLEFLTNEISSLWYWGMGVIAGWGLTTTVMIVSVILLWRRVNRLESQLKIYHSVAVSEGRNASLRLNKLEGTNG